MDKLIHPNLFSTFFFRTLGFPSQVSKLWLASKNTPCFLFLRRYVLHFWHTSFETFPCVKKTPGGFAWFFSYAGLVDCKDEKTSSKKTRTPNGTFLKHVFFSPKKSRIETKQIGTCNEVISICIFGTSGFRLVGLALFSYISGVEIATIQLGTWRPVTARNAGKYPAELLRSPKNCLGYACLWKNSTAFFRFMFPQHLQTGIGQ